jgi:hypothetical protein
VLISMRARFARGLPSQSITSQNRQQLEVILTASKCSSNKIGIVVR